MGVRGRGLNLYKDMFFSKFFENFPAAVSDSLFQNIVAVNSSFLAFSFTSISLSWLKRVNRLRERKKSDEGQVEVREGGVEETEEETRKRRSLLT